ncbi:hypothetical protein BDV37DRAFT_265647 [Aspergillus pseudonomiae]|uniref:Uncharacterized protein n=1 Tax=Aspergillus pseudonomiae TaxID=1506151 RepID=A0A5N7CTY0_9EURO|nr:uncharacterized protein BDV37DRAFT_265647 [Aspergillus pseudonomiae]KAE8397439.1 hypothetical protein BDV37DRAFT_265647 [Aspergillus pseudonomiae]
MEEEKDHPCQPDPPKPAPSQRKTPPPKTYLNDTSKHQDQDQGQRDHNEPDPNPPPPAYTPTVLIQNQTTHSAYRPSSILPKPVVIPGYAPPRMKENQNDLRDQVLRANKNMQTAITCVVKDALILET